MKLVQNIKQAHQQLLASPVLYQLCLNLLNRARNESHGGTLYVCVLFQPFALAIVLAVGCPPDKRTVQS